MTSEQSSRYEDAQDLRNEINRRIRQVGLLSFFSGLLISLAIALPTAVVLTQQSVKSQQINIHRNCLANQKSVQGVNDGRDGFRNFLIDDAKRAKTASSAEGALATALSAMNTDHRLDNLVRVLNLESANDRDHSSYWLGPDIFGKFKNLSVPKC